MEKENLANGTRFNVFKKISLLLFMKGFIKKLKLILIQIVMEFLYENILEIIDNCMFFSKRTKWILNNLPLD